MRRHRLVVLTCLGLLALTPGARPDSPPSPDETYLHSWWSEGRGDYHTTTDPRWAGSPTMVRSPDYVYSRIEGLVFKPELPRPPSTNTLFSWYSPGRGDNFITADPGWAGSAGQRRDPDYTFVRKEGYVFSQPVSGTVPLQSFWHAGSGDNFATSDPLWTGFPQGGVDRQGYDLYRTEGYVRPAPETRQKLLRSFGWGARQVRRSIPLVLMLVEYSDARFAPGHRREFYERLIYGPDAPNVSGYFQVQSGGKFTYSRLPVLGPAVFPDDPRTPVDESLLNCANNRSADTDRDGTEEPLCPGSTSDWDAGVLNMMQAQPDFDFARYDRDRNGELTNDELAVLVIGAEPIGSPRFPTVFPINGQGRDAIFTPWGSSVSLNLKVAYCGESVGFATIAHELSHASLDTKDTYGPRINGSNRLNRNATLMAATVFNSLDDRQLFHLDPYYKLRAGWIKPRVINMSSVMAPQSQTLYPPGDTRYNPLILFDNRRGTREFFILEFRNSGNSSDRYDAHGPAAGLAVWYVKVNAEYLPLMLPGVIEAGANGRIDSLLRGDDVVLTQTSGQQYIDTGPNDVLESILRTDDVIGFDVGLYYKGAPGQARGRGRLFDQRDGWINLFWPAAKPGGETTGARVRTGITSATSSALEIEITYLGAPFRARLDRVVQGSRVAAGTVIELRGAFGLPGGKVRIGGPGGRFDLETLSWAEGRILAATEGHPVGVYQVFVESSPSQTSNYLELEIY